MAVVNSSVPSYGNSIFSYLSLASEIKGDVEDFDNYFDSNNRPIVDKLNLLLLTQGWREYVWKLLADSALKIKYAPEKGIEISGKVRKIWSKAPVGYANITMFIPKARGQKLFATRTDSTGNFLIPEVCFFGYQYLNFTSRTNLGKKAGWIQIDSLRSFIPPVKHYRSSLYQPIGNSNLKEISVQNMQLKSKFSFNDVNQLAEVIIPQSRNVLPTEKIHITQTEHKEFSTLLQYLLYTIPGTNTKDGPCGQDTASRSPMLVYKNNRVQITGRYTNGNKIDQRFVCPWDYLGQPMNKIIQVTIKRRKSIDGIVPSIELLLRPNALDVRNYFANGMADLNGYYSARTFYNPISSAINNRNNFSAATIYWQPYVRLTDGQASVTYQHLGAGKKVMVELEGITDSGEPLAARTFFVVE